MSYKLWKQEKDQFETLLKNKWLSNGDMDGAMETWVKLNPEPVSPGLFEFIEDRDVIEYQQSEENINLIILIIKKCKI